MTSITTQQTKLDLEFVPKENQLDIRKCNGRIPCGLKPKEETFQVVLDVLALTPCYPAFVITVDVFEVYMHQFWNSIYKHHDFYRFKIDKNKRFKLTLETFRDIFQSCPKIEDQDFDALPSEEDASLDLMTESLLWKKMITEQVRNQLPQILPEEVSNFASPMIEKMTQESLNQVNLAKASSQPQSTYEAAATLTEFELKNILIDKMNSSESYLTALEHRECYDGLPKAPSLNQNPLESLFMRRNQSLRLEILICLKEFDELIPIDFSSYILNGLKIKNLAQEILLGPAFKLLKGTRSNYAELECDFEECYKALSEKLDWENPEGDDYPFDLSKPLPLIMLRNRQSVPVEFFSNNSPIKVAYDKHTLWGISHWRDQRITFYAYARGTQSRGDVYSTKCILAVTHVSAMRKHGYRYLEKTVVRRADNTLYKFKEDNFLRLRINDIEDMLLLVDQNRLTNLLGDDVVDFTITLRMFTRSLVIQKVLAKEKMGTLEKKIAHYMIKDINKMLKERRMMRIQNVFHQMEHAVEQHRLESKTFEIKMNQVLNENERLLEQVINKDIMNIVMNSSVNNASMNMHECKKCLKLKTELLNKKDFIKKDTYDKLFRSSITPEKLCISLEVDTQLNQEIFQRENFVSNQSAPSFDQYFKLNELKAQSQEKDTVISKLKGRIKSLCGNMNKDKVKMDIEEIETINIELDHRVSKLITKNEHLKQTSKLLYDLIKLTRARSKEQCDALTNQVNQKSMEISDLNENL
nr:hypothetical protein [Tanacetum cinerariifolium]